jgi:branched-chain amino acid transport system permease protein
MQAINKYGFYGQIILLVVLVMLPFIITSSYLNHIMTLILLWSFVATAWAYMARFGMVSLGHGIFLGIGAYFPTMMFNYWSFTPWIGIWVGVAIAVATAAVLGYACFRFGLLGDYFALVTLAVAEVSALTIMAFRETTGGSLGYTLRATGKISDMQFSDKRVYYFIALILLIGAVYIWRRIDRSPIRLALTAIEESEIAAASLGVSVIRYKMMITLLSAGLTALGGALYAQYVTYVSPDTIAGVGVSLSVCFKAILGGMFTVLGPFVGSTIIVALEEYVRISMGASFLGLSQIIFGISLLIMIIFLPKGIMGSMSLAISRKLNRID